MANTQTLYVQIEPVGEVQEPKGFESPKLQVGGIEIAQSVFQTTLGAQQLANFGQNGQPTDYEQFAVVGISTTPFPGDAVILRSFDLDGDTANYLERLMAFNVPADYVIPPDLVRNGTPDASPAFTPHTPPPGTQPVTPPSPEPNPPVINPPNPPVINPPETMLPPTIPPDTMPIPFAPNDPDTGLTTAIDPESEAAKVNDEIKQKVATEAALDKGNETIIKLFNLNAALGISKEEVEYEMKILDNTGNIFNIAKIDQLWTKLDTDYQSDASPETIKEDVVNTTNEVVGDFLSFGFGKGADALFGSKGPFGGVTTEYAGLSKIGVDVAAQAAGIYASWKIEDSLASALLQAGSATPQEVIPEEPIVFRDPGVPPPDHFIDPNGNLSGPAQQLPLDPNGNLHGAPPPTNIGQQFNTDGSYAVTPQTIGVDISNLYISFIYDHLQGMPDGSDTMKLALDLTRAPPASDPATIGAIADTIGAVLGGSPTVSNTPKYLAQIIKDEIANTPPTPGVNPVTDYVTKHIFNSETGGGSVGHFLLDIGNGMTPSGAYTDTTGKPATFGI